MTNKRVKYVEMVKGLAILSIAIYHMIAPGVLKTIFSGFFSQSLHHHPQEPYRTT